MWRFSPDRPTRDFAQRFLTAVEDGLGKPVFPDRHTRWHVEDKVAQQLMFRALGVATPMTRIFRDRDQALAYLREAPFPLVLKLASGFQSRNVRILRGFDEARYFLDQLFGPGVTSLAYGPAGRLRTLARTVRQSANVLRGRSSPDPGPENERHQGYFLIQELVPHNEYDTRITVIGDRAFGFRRFNRPNDFRASGSGRIDWDPAEIDERTVRTAFGIAEDLQAQTVGIDALRQDDRILVLELTVTYASWLLRECPGHWRRKRRDPEKLEWVEGPMHPEDAIFEDFLERLGGGPASAGR